jgi:DNA-binding MarR family transcriptional regulator
MNTGELFILSRRLMKVAEDHLPLGPKGGANTSTRLILIDVAANSGTSISEIVVRTGFPQSLVSSTVAKLKEIGVVDSAADPVDRRRTLVTVTPMANDRARNNPAAAAPLERTLADAMPGASVADLAQVVAALELLARHLIPNVLDEMPHVPDEPRNHVATKEEAP